MIPTFILVGVNPPSRILLLYVLALTTVVLNQMRQLADHHFTGDGEIASWAWEDERQRVIGHRDRIRVKLASL